MTTLDRSCNTLSREMFDGLNVYHNVNPRIAELYAGERIVLDVGCGSGALGAWIKQVTPDAIVHGIDISPEAGEQAKTKLDSFWCLDLDLMPLPFTGFQYDLIILGDVLEHLKRPDSFLTGLHSVLAPGGKVIASVPNIGNYSIRLRLLLGEFRYTESGIMDRTHLRFFTWKSFSELILQSGFEIEKRTIISRFSSPLLLILFRLLAVQFIVKLRRS